MRDEGTRGGRRRGPHPLTRFLLPAVELFVVAALAGSVIPSVFTPTLTAARTDDERMAWALLVGLMALFLLITRGAAMVRSLIPGPEAGTPAVASRGTASPAGDQVSGYAETSRGSIRG